MLKLNFPRNLISLILECVREPAFSVLLNGASCGFFNSTRGLRQGCPLSPYLFCIIMEHFSTLLNECALNGLIPTPFNKRNLHVSHLLFADDVLIYSKASILVVGNLKMFLADFGRFSRLVVNGRKSSILFSNCDENLKESVSSVVQFGKMTLPAIYLGLPLITSRLRVSDCMPIVEKIWRRLSGWKPKLLSFTGRAELIKSTLCSYHFYWRTSFLLPKSCINVTEKHIRGFFWGCYDDLRKMQTVAWSRICLPKN